LAPSRRIIVSWQVMTITMQDDHITSIAQLREFAMFPDGATFNKTNAAEAYKWIGQTLDRLQYRNLTKKDKGPVRTYLRRMTGYSDAQLDRLIAQKKLVGTIAKKERTQPTFPRIYTTEDIALIAEVDSAEDRRTGGALKQTLFDMFHVYGDARFARLTNISISHLYNLRGTHLYQTHAFTYTKTHYTAVCIGIRKKPRPEGKPGYIRVDSVHQGDKDKEKGVYHINMVDEVTQTEVLVCVEGISEYFLIPALEEALVQFPFRIINFHSDNGSEYINKRVEQLLNGLMIKQTKSRSLKTNDNALVEGKNAAVPRKQFGHAHIPKQHASRINAFDRDFLNPYLFFHRQCAFAKEYVNEKGKIKKVYDTYRTPCQKLLSIPNVEQYLCSGVTKESLMARAMEHTHLAAAQEMRAARKQLFTEINRSMIH